MNKNITKNIVLLAGVLCVGQAGAALTAVSSSDLNAVAALGNHEASQWDVFGSAYNGANYGDVHNASGAAVTQNTPGALLTSGGNIYSFMSSQSFTLSGASASVDVATGNFLANVVLQIHTQGSPVDFGSVILTYTDDLGMTHVANLYGLSYQREESAFVDPEGTTQISYEDQTAFQWDLSGTSAVSFHIDFNAPVHTSMDEIRLDTVVSNAGAASFLGVVSPIPEPSSLLLLSISSLILLRRRRA